MHNLNHFFKDTSESKGLLNNVKCFIDETGMDLELDRCEIVSFKQGIIPETQSIIWILSEILVNWGKNCMSQ